MRLSKPIYAGLPSCRGLPDEEVERLCRLVHRRKPSLMAFPFGSLALFLIFVGIPRRVSDWLGIRMGWILVLALALGIAVLLYEYLVHRPAVDNEIKRILAEQAAAPNRGPGTRLGDAAVRGAPPSVS